MGALDQALGSLGLPGAQGGNAAKGGSFQSSGPASVAGGKRKRKSGKRKSAKRKSGKRKSGKRKSGKRKSGKRRK